MPLAKELKERGFIHQHTGENLEEILDGGPRVVYHGIDPSADSAHAGNMVLWMLLRHLHNAGHTVIFLVGGGTGMIGDPKPDAERTLQDETVVASNVQKIKAQAERLIGANSSMIFVNNADWLLAQPLIAFLRDIGKHFTVNELIKKDAIAARMENEQGISYTEFAYPILQAFDYLTLFEKYTCTVQIGGSDQWGNIVSGVDLIRRKRQQVVHAITTPLVTDKATGKKFGKSEGNAVWLDSEKTSPYAFYQFWLNTSDESVVEYLKMFTFLSLEDIAAIETEFKKNPGAREAQRKLAHEVTSFVHGKETADLVCEASSILFGEGNVRMMHDDALTMLLENAPISREFQDKPLADVLVETGLAASKREARQFIADGAITLDGVKLTDGEMHLTVEKAAILRRGKKNLVVLVQS